MTLHILPDRPPPQKLREAVTQALPALDAPWHQLEGGRVNRLWRVGDTVIKQFADTGASPLFPNDPKAEAAALVHLAPLEIAPNLLAQGKGWLAYRFSPGKPWVENSDNVAKALVRLHQTPVPAHGFRLGPNGSAQLLSQACAIAAACSASLPPPPPDSQVSPGPTHLIHGDAVPGNIIIQDGRVTLIDWQCPAIGDPAEDIATFLSPAMQWLYRGAELDTEEIARFRANCQPETISRYDRLAMIFHWRMAAHCLWKSEHDASDYAQAMHLELRALERLAQNNAP
jgi:hypothetical protein